MSEHAEWTEEMRPVPIWEENPQLLEHLRTGLLFLRDGSVLYANPAAHRMLGYELGSLVGKTLTELFPEEIHPQVHEAVDAICHQKKTPAVHLSEITYQPTRMHLNIHLTLVRSRQGCMLMVLLYDLTSLINALKRSQEAEQRIHDLLATLPGAVWEFDLHARRFTFLSDYANSILQKEQLERLTRDVEYLFTQLHPDDNEKLLEMLQSDWQLPQPIAWRFRLRDERVRGGWRWLEHHFVVVRDEEDKPVALRGVTLDVHEQVEVQENLRVYAKQLEALVEFSSRFVSAETEDDVVYTLAHLFLESRTFEHLTVFILRSDDSVEKASLVGNTVHWEKLPPLNGRSTRLREVLRGDIPYFVSQDALRDVSDIEREVWMHILGGVDKVFSNALVPIRGRKQILGALAVDRRESGKPITETEVSMLLTIGSYAGLALENVRLVNDLRIAEERWRHMVQNLPVVIWELDIKGDRLVFVSEYIERWLGTPTEQWLNTRRMYRQIVHPDDLPQFERLLEAPYQYERQPIDLRLRDQSGKWHWSRTLWAVTNGLRDRPLLRGVTMDITAQKQAEQEALRLQRLRSLGELASGVAHDFNNLLTGIMANAETLLQLLPRQDVELRKRVQAIIDLAQNAAGIVVRMQNAYNPHLSTQRQRISLVELISEVVEATRPLWQDIPQRQGMLISIEMVVQASPIVEVRVSELHEVFTNLILNARDAMPQGGKITITVSEQDGHAVIEFADTGVGMSPEVLERCFEPFFTTKGEQGSGLGLSVCYQIVTRHAGQIKIRSEEGKGTVVTVTLPLVGQGEFVPSQPETVHPSTTLRLMLVEDEDIVRTALQQLLQADGHQVVVFANGEDALAHFTKEMADVAILDLGMPGMDGLSLARQLKKRAPELPIILLTGWGEQVRADNPPEVDLVLSKPVRRAELRSAIEQVVERKG